MSTPNYQKRLIGDPEKEHAAMEVDRKIRWHSVDYRADPGERGWVNRGFWIHNTPRLMPLCRLFGHKPVIDGVDYRNPKAERPRWVVCDGCGIRAGNLVTDLPIGARHTGPLPQPWGEPTGTIGGQLVIGPASMTVSAEVKIGNSGSEHLLAGHVHLGNLGALYLHTERHGRWLQRRLNPTGYKSRVTGFAIHDGNFYGRIWADRDGWSRKDPRWQQWSFTIDPRTILLGHARYGYTDVGDPVEAVVRMPHGDDHPVTLQLQRQSHGRDRSKRRRLSWLVHWESERGIPTKSHSSGGSTSSGEKVDDQAVENGTWPAQACASIASRMTAQRVRYGYHDSAEEGT